MPFYEYECTECGKKFTIEQSMQKHSEQKKPRCPDCKKSKPVERDLSPAYVQTSKKS